MRADVVCGLATATLAACTPLSGLDEVGGLDASAASDVAAPPDVAADGTHAAGDARAPDATADVAEMGFCTRNADVAGLLFCDDFDQPGRVDVGMQGWGPIVNYPEGQIEGLYFDSPPHGLTIVLGTDAGGGGRAGVTRTFPFMSEKKAFTLALKVRPAIGNTSSLAFALVLAGSGCTIAVSAGGGTTVYCPTGTGGPMASALPEAQWTPAVLTLTRRSPAPGLKITLTTGSGPLSVTDSTVLPSTLQDASIVDDNVAVVLGEAANDELGAASYDDVLVLVN